MRTFTADKNIIAVLAALTLIALGYLAGESVIRPTIAAASSCAIAPDPAASDEELYVVGCSGLL